MPPFSVVLTRVLLSALAIPDDASAPLPTEFLIFARGVNDSQRGPHLFDAEAARSVMTTYTREGVDLMFDLEHDSLDEEKRIARADAGDAMGWYQLELRSDGSLWGVNVRYSAEGERRLRQKLQRYTSPAFLADKETGRIVELINVAICSRPATYNNAPLVAATRRDLRTVTERAKWYVTRARALAKAEKILRTRKNGC